MIVHFFSHLHFEFVFGLHRMFSRIVVLLAATVAAGIASSVRERSELEHCVARAYEELPEDVLQVVGAGRRLDDCAFSQALCTDVATHGAHADLRDNYELYFVSSSTRTIVPMTKKRGSQLKDVTAMYVSSAYDATLVRCLLRAAGQASPDVRVADSLEGEAIAVVAPYDGRVVTKLRERGYTPMDCQMVDKDLLATMLPQIKAEAHSLETARSSLWLWGSRFAVCVRRRRPHESFTEFGPSVELEPSRSLPKCVRSGVPTVNGERVEVVGHSAASSNGTYFAHDSTELCEAIPVTSVESDATTDGGNIYGSGDWAPGTSIFFRDWQVFGEVTDSADGKFTAKVSAKTNDDDSPDHECYERPDILVRRMCPTTWDRRCKFDAECPFFHGVGRGGGCSNGYCELPMGLERTGFRTYAAGGRPVCKGCPTADDPYCCDGQAPLPDFAFR
jgi:hypothetical protein